MNVNRHSVCKLNHLRIAYPCRSRNNYLIAGIAYCLQSVNQRMLCTVAYYNIWRIVIKPVVSLKLPANSLFQLKCTWSRSVFGKPAFIASIAAFFMWSGVSKSGSPAPNPLYQFLLTSSFRFCIYSQRGRRLIESAFLKLPFIPSKTIWYDIMYLILIYNIRFCKLLI